MNNKSNEQLGRELAEKAGLGIVVDAGEVAKYRTDKSPFKPVENLCTSLDAIAEIEKIVIEKVGEQGYFYAIRNLVIRESDQRKPPHFINCLVVVAAARQRAEACLAALKTLE